MDLRARTLKIKLTTGTHPQNEGLLLSMGSLAVNEKQHVKLGLNYTGSSFPESTKGTM